eukprot:g5040.t1
MAHPPPLTNGAQAAALAANTDDTDDDHDDDDEPLSALLKAADDALDAASTWKNSPMVQRSLSIDRADIKSLDLSLRSLDLSDSERDEGDRHDDDDPINNKSPPRRHAAGGRSQAQEREQATRRCLHQWFVVAHQLTAAARGAAAAGKVHQRRLTIAAAETAAAHARHAELSRMMVTVVLKERVVALIEVFRVRSRAWVAKAFNKWDRMRLKAAYVAKKRELRRQRQAATAANVGIEALGSVVEGQSRRMRSLHHSVAAGSDGGGSSAAAGAGAAAGHVSTGPWLPQTPPRSAGGSSPGGNALFMSGSSPVARHDGGGGGGGAGAGAGAGAGRFSSPQRATAIRSHAAAMATDSLLLLSNGLERRRLPVEQQFGGSHFTSSAGRRRRGRRGEASPAAAAPAAPAASPATGGSASSSTTTAPGIDLAETLRERAAVELESLLRGSDSEAADLRGKLQDLESRERQHRWEKDAANAARDRAEAAAQDLQARLREALGRQDDLHAKLEAAERSKLALQAKLDAAVDLPRMVYDDGGREGQGGGGSSSSSSSHRGGGGGGGGGGHGGGGGGVASPAFSVSRVQEQDDSDLAYDERYHQDQQSPSTRRRG